MNEILALSLSALLGGVIGYERSKVHKPAGLRTHILVSLGSCLFMILSIKFFDDPARIAAGVVSGIGFIGAGTIIAERRERTRIVGITTAASLWVTAAIGMAVGMGEYILAAFTALLTYGVLQLKKIEEKIESG